jgi:uncharacterized protein YodC (DUF2158 family)
MKNYTINDFKIGEKVYHLSTSGYPTFFMIVIEIHKETNEITCRWQDATGEVKKQDFIPEELGKTSDLTDTY